MDGDGDCYVSFLPITKEDKVQLARCGNTIYKFKIVQNAFLEKLLKNANICDIQRQIELAIDYILSQNLVTFPEDSVINMSHFAVRIKTKPWYLASILVFFNENGKYPAGKTQFILTLEKAHLCSDRINIKSLKEDKRKQNLSSDTLCISGVNDNEKISKTLPQQKNAKVTVAYSSIYSIPVHVVENGKTGFNCSEIDAHTKSFTTSNGIKKTEDHLHTEVTKEQQASTCVQWCCLLLLLCLVAVSIFHAKPLQMLLDIQTCCII